MTKLQLAKNIANRTDMTIDRSIEIIDLVTEAIVDAVVYNKKVKIKGFGTFSTYKRKEKWCMNPHTKERMLAPAKKVPVFRAGTTFKSEVKEFN